MYDEKVTIDGQLLSKSLPRKSNTFSDIYVDVIAPVLNTSLIYK